MEDKNNKTVKISKRNYNLLKTLYRKTVGDSRLFHIHSFI